MILIISNFSFVLFFCLCEFLFPSTLSLKTFDSVAQNIFRDITINYQGTRESDERLASLFSNQDQRFKEEK